MSRRIKMVQVFTCAIEPPLGEYVLTEEDIVDQVTFFDTIGVDSNRQNPKGPRHSPDGMEGSILDTETREQMATLYTYEIPYRCLLPQGREVVDVELEAQGGE